MPPMGLRLRFIILLAGLLLAYGGVYAYLTATSERGLVFQEATQR